MHGGHEARIITVCETVMSVIQQVIDDLLGTKASARDGIDRTGKCNILGSLLRQILAVVIDEGGL